MKKDKILKILEKVPLETKLYSTTFGQLKYNGTNYYTNGNQKISLITENDVIITYLPNGKYKEGGEITLCPSKDMRDWDKFAWEKGDVLVNNKGKFCIFKEFSGYPYTTFIATFVNNIGIMIGSIIKDTQEWRKASSQDAEKYIEYVNTNLKKVDRRLNLETLEVEKTKFEDGDILYGEKDAMHMSVIFILKMDKEKIKYYACLPLDSNMKCYYDYASFIGNKTLRYAKVEEIAKLFNTLAKEGKRWNAEKKVIENIKTAPKRLKPTYKKVSDQPEHKFKPFEKVLVRSLKTNKWMPSYFGYEDSTEDDEFKYVCITSAWKYCIPYKGNEHLLGTTNSPED